MSAAKAKAELSSLVSRVAYGGERFVIERHGKPVAALVSAEDLARVTGGSPAPVATHGALIFHEALGGILTDEEVDEMIAAIYDARDRDVARPVPLFDDL